MTDSDFPSGNAKFRGRCCCRRGSPRSRGAPEGVFGVGWVAAVPRGGIRDDGVCGERLLGTLRALSHIFYAEQHG